MTLGAISGFLYWKFVGCANGTCAIKSNPYLMLLYGVLIGGVIGNLFNDYVLKRKNKSM